jgi:ribose/xylose/arabinose/galactoside ABC-type transport system permease subunit
LLLFTFLTIASPVFLTHTNIINIIRQISVVGIIAVGMTYVIITGGIDLSVSAIVALAGVITTSMLRKDNPQSQMHPSAWPSGGRGLRRVFGLLSQSSRSRL